MTIAPRLRRAFAAYPRAFAWTACACALVGLVLLLQLLHRPSLLYVLAWPLTRPGPLVLNLAIVAIAFGLLYAALNSAFDALAGLTAVVLLLGYANRLKVTKLNLPVLPSDALFLRELAALDAYYATLFVVGGVAAAVAAVLLRYVRRRVPHLRAPRLVRASILVSLAALLAYAIPHRGPLLERLNRSLGIQNRVWNQIENYRYNGVLYGLLMNADGMLIREPPGYGREAIEALLREHPSVPARGSSRPNVILFMSESFWDLRKLDGLALDFEAAPHYRSLVDSGFGFQLVTSTFGGGTCDPEFEILTGLPVKYFPPGSRAYQQYVMRPLPSIARLFKRHGYYTAGVHTYHRWYWSRDRVYPFLGFDAFRGIEDIAAPERKGLYASDHQLVKSILEETGRSDRPYFIFAISMQNHGPYASDRYAAYDVPTPAGLSPRAAAELRNYAQGLVDADRSLQELVQFVDAQDEPTVLVFFGDHLPAADALFAESGFLSDARSPAEDARRRYTGVGVVHANFEVPRPDGRVLATQFLPLYVAELAGVELPPVYGFLASVRERLPGFSRYVTIDAAGRTIAQDAAEVRAVDAGYSMLVYDLLFGENHAAPYVPGP